MPWRMDSTAGAAIWDTQPMSTDDLALRDDEIRWLMQKERQSWKLVNGRISQKGDPVANVGSYTSLGAYPPTQTQTSTAVTTATPGTAIWTSTIFSPILGNSVIAGSGYRIAASGTIQTSAGSLDGHDAAGDRIGDRQCGYGGDAGDARSVGCLRDARYDAHVDLVPPGRF